MVNPRSICSTRGPGGGAGDGGGSWQGHPPLNGPRAPPRPPATEDPSRVDGRRVAARRALAQQAALA